jgi:hypothetical protein
MESISAYIQAPSYRCCAMGSSSSSTTTSTRCLKQVKRDRAMEIIKKEMHLGDFPTKWRDAKFFYTKRVAARLRTNWSKYHTVGGDFNWDIPKFRDEWVLQLTPTFIDIGQVNSDAPTKDNTFLCHPEIDVLCQRNWFPPRSGGIHGDYYKPPSNWSPSQLDYGGYNEQIKLPGRRNGGGLFGKDGTKNDANGRAAYMKKMLQQFPNYWEKGNN